MSPDAQPRNSQDPGSQFPSSQSPASPYLRSHWAGEASRAEIAHWGSVARTVADTLAEDAVARDRANQTPHYEAGLLKESGLTILLEPVALGGGGAHWETAFHVIRILARADASIAQLLAYHYINAANIVFSFRDPQLREPWHRRSIEGRWIWGDSVNPTDPDLTLEPSGDGFVLTGRKRYSTGSAVGDALLVNARVSDGPQEGEVLALVLERGREGVEFLDDWDFLGQRLSSSNSVVYHHVRVEPADVLGPLTSEPFTTLITPGIQLPFCSLYLGIAEGALARARELTNARPGAWFLSRAEQYRHDPFVQRLFGEFKARLSAVAALLDRVGARFDEVIALGDDVTEQVRGELAVEIAELKVVSSELATDLTHRIFEATGTSSTASSHGFDLFWRNIRTHSLHDPVDYKKLEVGAHYLNGEFQPISLYT